MEFFSRELWRWEDSRLFLRTNKHWQRFLKIDLRSNCYNVSHSCPKIRDCDVLNNSNQNNAFYDQDYNGVDVASSYWTGPELLELFNMNGLGESAYLSFIAASSSAISASNKAKDENRYSSSKTSVKPIISTSTKVILDHLLFAIQKLSSAELINDYRAYITETTVKDYKYVSVVCITINYDQLVNSVLKWF